MKKVVKCLHPTPVGNLLLEANQNALISLRFENQYQISQFIPQSAQNHPILKLAKQELDYYFSTRLQNFSTPLKAVGSEFQQKVWSALQKIPYGSTISYGALAKNISLPNAARAVGNANNKNPIPIFIPCHRVIRSSGNYSGFAGTTRIKEKLLILEKNS